MPDTVLVHFRIKIGHVVAVRSHVLNIKTSIPAAIPVGNTILDKIQSDGEVQARPPIKVGLKGGMEERSVNGHLEQSTLGLTDNGLGVDVCLVRVVPLLTRTAIDEIYDRIEY